MKRSKLLSLLAAIAAAAVMLSGCGDGDSSGGASSAAETSSAAEAVSEAESKAEESKAAESTAEETPEETPDLKRSGEIRKLNAAELIAEMKTGWNLGNSLDATGGKGLSSETSWGNPKITKEMISAVHAGGFDIIRIPVTWGGHLGTAPNYTIDTDWLDRVQEVVNYAYDEGMYVILNSHHEEDWRIPDNAHIDAVDAEVRALWTQIAERFKDYGDHLILEGLNEPRVKGGTNEWNGGTEEGRKCVNRLNKTFVDAVRGTGGNNSERLLLMTTFASSCTTKAIKDAEIPEDSHIAFSIHAYTPYNFTYHSNDSAELFTWDGSHDGDIEYMMYNLQDLLVKKGVPVIITEFGAVNKDSNDAEVAKWVTKYLSLAKQIGIPCVWWDNGYYFSGNELFGIFDRSSCEWFSQTVVDAIMAVYK